MKKIYASTISCKFHYFFCKIIADLCKRIMSLKNIMQKENLYLDNQWQKIANFANFRQNNRVCKEKKNHMFKKYKLRWKFIFWQLVVKNCEFCRFSMKWHIHAIKKFQPWGKFIFWQLFTNFADFQRNDSVFLNIAH